ncbi:N-acetylneuraminate synthase family protein [Desulfovibrio ferrophilus]|uniref:N-acetylneuraminic acid synthetase n=1 Tax=Desulfovibrio ferrophilus TaxID=241368 RepID=A0A2Z6B250_9BACT|nr:N-acetylneuraminate synthase family protein [Desulfovibrio ferrophilus]BBD09582.1 N-acetylneuraminic acid synthetase [Desulfovibrio ferrophilus]
MDLIAEIGWNHMGDFDLIEKMTRAAAEAGATYAKFQTWSEPQLKAGPWDDDGRRDIYKKAQLSVEDFQKTKAVCEANNVGFLTSLFNPEDIEPMAAISDAAIKIPSPEISNIRLLEGVAKRFKKVFFSTGASTEQEIDTALSILRKGSAEIVILHCVSLYPCPDEKVNLPRIATLRTKHDKVGFSDHTPDNLSALFAVGMGVDCIEKHFTIDNNLPGRDNLFALLPDAFKEIAEAAARFQAMNADLGLNFLPEEQEVREVYRGRWSQEA